MLIIPYRVAPSFIHGAGVFTYLPLSSGQLVWTFNADVDRFVAFTEIKNLSMQEQHELAVFGYAPPGCEYYVVNGDGAKYINHSCTPNLVESTDGSHRTYAAKDIEAGEELTIDYRTICQFSKDEAYIREH